MRPDGTVGVAVVGHGSREAIELFDLEASGRAARLTWRGCVPLAEGTTANDLALLPDGGLVVANYAPAFGGTRGMAWMIAARLGLDTGDVLEWSRRSGWRHVPGTAARGANGIAVSAGRERWFTESGAQRIGRIGAAKEGEAPDVTRAPIEGAPDNLAWTGRGTLLTTTHLSPLGFLACAFGRLPCRASWQLVEIDPRTLATSVLLRHDGSVVGAVSSAAEYEGRYYLGAVFDDRIGVWAPAP